MRAEILGVKCITNLHIGTSVNTYGDIKSDVEKDAILGTPILPSSGIKGALRDFWRENKKENESIIFGSNPDETDEREKGRKGRCKFINGQLLFRPMRVSRGNYAYCMVTTPELLSMLLETAENFQVNFMEGDSKGIKERLSEIREELRQYQDQKTAGIFYAEESMIYEVEGYDIKAAKSQGDVFVQFLLKKSQGLPVVIMKTEFFETIDLPIVARNHLKDGKSSNLWYEEIVPHQSFFYFVVIWEGEEEEIFSSFINEICMQPVSFGGNNSVGNGYCLIKSICERGEKSDGK